MATLLFHIPLPLLRHTLRQFIPSDEESLFGSNQIPTNILSIAVFCHYIPSPIITKYKRILLLKSYFSTTTDNLEWTFSTTYMIDFSHDPLPPLQHYLMGWIIWKYIELYFIFLQYQITRPISSQSRPFSDEIQHFGCIWGSITTVTTLIDLSFSHPWIRCPFDELCMRMMSGAGIMFSTI